MRNFYAEQVLLEQPFVKDDKQTVGQLAKEAETERSNSWCIGSWANKESRANGSRLADRCNVLELVIGIWSLVIYRVEPHAL